MTYRWADLGERQWSRHIATVGQILIPGEWLSTGARGQVLAAAELLDELLDELVDELDDVAGDAAAFVPDESADLVAVSVFLVSVVDELFLSRESVR